MGLTLLMDSSHQEMMIGLAKDQTLLTSFRTLAWQQQSERMIPTIVDLCDQAHIRLKDVQSIIVGRGPGSYTGTRIALTIAKVLATVHSVEVRLISSMHMLADQHQPTIVVYDARAERSYVGVYQGLNIMVEEAIWPNQEVENYIKKHPHLLRRGSHSKLSIPLTIEDPFLMMLELGMATQPILNGQDIMPTYVKEKV